jgi:biopolymer transport protein ExbD
MKKKKRKSDGGCPVDMTPMIDVVFQLIIFFVVTIKMDEDNKDIKLAMAPDGPVLEEEDPRSLTVEVTGDGKLTMQGTPLSWQAFSNLMTRRVRQHGAKFPVLIRGDGRAQHKYVRKVMDICTAHGLWRINFIAIKEEKEKGTAFEKADRRRGIR